MMYLRSLTKKSSLRFDYCSTINLIESSSRYLGPIVEFKWTRKATLRAEGIYSARASSC